MIVSVPVVGIFGWRVEVWEESEDGIVGFSPGCRDFWLASNSSQSNINHQYSVSVPVVGIFGWRVDSRSVEQIITLVSVPVVGIFGWRGRISSLLMAVPPCFSPGCRDFWLASSATGASDPQSVVSVPVVGIFGWRGLAACPLSLASVVSVPVVGIFGWRASCFSSFKSRQNRFSPGCRDFWLARRQ